MQAIQAAAVEVDAEPGMQAGFHVHVDMNDADMNTKANVLWAFMLWEPFITQVAKGRFELMRSMNTSVRRMMGNYRYITDEMNSNQLAKNEAFQWYRNQDRHTNLNCRTNYGTLEFRVWNSTRSAWRMEMFSRLSVALANRNVAAHLSTNKPTMVNTYGDEYTGVLSTENVELFKAGLRAGRQGAAIDVLDRQLAFISDGRATNLEFTTA